MTKVNVNVNYVHLNKLSKYPNNPRTITEPDLLALCESIKEDPLYFETRPIICSNRTSNLVIIAGEKRYLAAERVGLKEVPVATIPNLSEDDELRILFKDNGSFGQWDKEALKEWDFDFSLLKGWGVDIDFSESTFNSDQTIEEKTDEARKSLIERFIVPPFSILDTRQGYWQNRKQNWIDLGIKSEESRESMKVSGAFSGSVPGYYNYKAETEKKLGRQITNKEFEENYLREIISNGSKNLAYTDSGGLLSIFDPVLCEVVYSWFATSGGLIIDPFAGGSVRGIVAGYLGYKYFGVDLRREQVEANIRQKDILIAGSDVNWLTGNSLNLKTLSRGLKADLIFSCPPYYDLEVYSENKEDLSNLEWEEFRSQYSQIIAQSVEILNDNSFACFVVGDIRDENGFYRNFISLTIESFERAGAKLYNELVLVNVAGSLPIRVAKQFNTSRKTGKCHQNVLVFYKGDPKKIKEKFPELDYSLVENELLETV